MDTISISKRQLKNLNKLEFNQKICNTEGTICIIDDKCLWNKNKQVAKLFLNYKESNLNNKIVTIEELLKLKSKINIDELVMPNKIIKNNNKIVGYTMDYIYNINFSNFYNNPKIDPKIIINYLKQIGEILEKIENLNKYKVVDKFYLNDVHEANFIINKKNNKINVIDIDSCKIGKNKPFLSKYLSPYSCIELFPNKYKISKEKSEGYIEPSINSDLFCYNIMILNYLYKDNIFKLSLNQYLKYLDYLISRGFRYELVDCFYNLYSNKDNKNPKDFLDIIPENIEKANYLVYSRFTH